MATVPELKATAESMGIKITSRMRKPEIEQAIADKISAESVKATHRAARDVRKNAETLSNEINTPDPTATPSDAELKAQRAREAGARGISAAPLSNGSRELNYWNQFVGSHGREGFKITPAQARRMRKKSRRALTAA